MTTRLRDASAFLRRAVADFGVVGAVAPSSRHLAAALCLGLDALPAGRRRVLEVGGGTGAVTREILRRLSGDDRLVVYEIDPVFAARLRADPAVRAAGRRVEIRCADVRALPAGETYDAVIAALPFQNFPPNLIAEIWGVLLAAVPAGGTVSFFRYACIGAARRALPTEAGRRARAARAALTAAVAGRVAARRLVLRNLPPAWAFLVRA